MLQKQNNRCKICNSNKPGQNKKYFCIDHNHKTGKVRGLLCQKCNRTLGIFKDDPKLIRKFIQYLEETDN